MNIFHVRNYALKGELAFADQKDCRRFITLLDYYKIKTPQRFAFRKRKKLERAETDNNPFVEIICYCLMPDHFHLLLKEVKKGGVSKFLSLVSNSYTKYFNARYKRSGPLFKGRFKEQRIKDNQLLEISRHIHLDPLTKGIVRNLERFPFSSYLEFVNLAEGICSKDIILSKFETPKQYKNYVSEKI